jgi:DNA processing protein
MLSASGIAVISGMAFGIDSAVHRGSLEGGGPSLAVLGAGPERPYPRSRARLYADLLAAGAVVSELPPGTPTFRWMFPARNRLMASMSELTIVVEAAERSGSLITAEMAADIGVAVGAVPGPVDSWRSSGANALLAEGAAVIRGPQDALDQLLGPGAVGLGTPAGPQIGADGLATLAAVRDGARTPDGVIAATGLDPPRASAALALLELSRYVRADAAGRYTATGLEPPGAAPTITA